VAGTVYLFRIQRRNTMSWELRTIQIIALAALPIHLYVGLRIVASVGLLIPARRALARKLFIAGILWVSLLPLALFLARLAGLGWASSAYESAAGWMDPLFLYPIWLALIASAEMLTPFIVLDLAGLLSRLFPARRGSARVALAYARLGIAALAVMYVPSRALFDTSFVEDAETRLPMKGLSHELEGLRITLVGDIQVDRFTGDAKVGRVHSIVSGQKPEILLSSGDLVTRGREYLDEARDAICGMAGSVASVAVMGDHDHWSAPEDLRAMQEECGWEFLANEHRVITYRGRTILVSGLTHIYSSRLPQSALVEYLRAAPEADLRILLAHQPAEGVVETAADAGYDIVLAGHTHGGQIVFHPFGFPLTPSMRETKYYAGYHQVGETHVVVTRGVGLTLAPVRYHARAEVTTLVLEAGSRGE
jgi:hypothetical protein